MKDVFLVYDKSCFYKNVITARANAYVDFAVEVAKKLDLFASEADLQETINFCKHYQRVQ